MRKLLTIALATAVMASYATIGNAGVSAMVHAPAYSSVQKAEWHDCHDWDNHRHECRDHGWDRHHDHSWFGPESCHHHGHDHFLGEDGHWHECHHM